METSDLGPVAIGDTFERLYWEPGPEPGGAWEVTAESAGGVYSIENGDRFMLATAAQLLDPARWRRVRAL